MTFRGYSILAVLAGLSLLGALGQSISGLFLQNWWLMADAGVMAVAGVGLAVLSVLDD